jgi:hypothetical protein
MGFYAEQDKTILEQLRYYLFEDEFYSGHKNIQTRFLSSGVAPSTIQSVYVDKGAYSPVERTQNWFLDTGVLSLDVAKSNLDRCSIVGVVDDHESYLDRVLEWVSVHLGLDVAQEFKDELAGQGVGTEMRPYYNYSSVVDFTSHTLYTTESIKQLLTAEETGRIYADNALDLELYNYAKEKQFQKLQAREKQGQTIPIYRDGNLVTKSTTEIVVGDIIKLEKGKEIPADCILISGNNMTCNESS